MTRYESLTDAVGDTPLVGLPNLSPRWEGENRVRLCDARKHFGRASAIVGNVRRADHLLARRGRLEPGCRHRQAVGRAVPRLGDALSLSLIHISEPTRRTPISYA